MNDTDMKPDAVSTIAQMVRAAEQHADDSSHDRIQAMEYYQGIMRDTPSDVGRSSMVSRDVRAMIKKVLPSIMRTMFGSDIVGEYQPVDQGDEEGAQQATDYVNRVVLPEVNARRHIEDAIHDALRLRNGILRWWWEEKTVTTTSYHSGLTGEGFGQLAGSDDVEVLEHTEREEVVEVMGPDGMPVQMPMPVHDVRIKRTETKGRPRASCVPRERFLIHPDAITLEDSILTGEKMQLTRSDLIAMGYDKDAVEGACEATEDDEEAIRRQDVSDSREVHGPNQSVDYYDIYVRFDADGDGIAELHHMCFAGGLGEGNLLHDEECDEIQFCDLKALTNPHQWEGISLADDLMDIQRAKTVLLRQTLDNIYWQNNPQPIMQKGAIANPDAVFSPEFGLPIEVNQGFDVRQAVTFAQVPFVAQQSFGMMEYIDGEAQDRTGITDASGGMAPDALQNQTATATALIERQGIGQTEMMVRTLAEGVGCFFRGLLRLIIKHQDVARTVRLRGEWVEFDPRHWNAAMDCTVNVGLGAGTRERDMQMMQYVMQLQEKLLMSMGPNNPYVKPENLWEALSKSVEAAGLKTPELYFTEPDPQEIEALLAQQGQDSGAEADMAAKQAEMQMEAEMKQAEMQQEMALKREQMQIEAELKREQMAAEMQLKREQMAMQASMPSTGSLGGGIRMGGEIG